jgi:hypothetical protein
MTLELSPILKKMQVDTSFSKTKKGKYIFSFKDIFHNI